MSGNLMVPVLSPQGNFWRVCALIPLCVGQQSQLYGLQGTGDVCDHFLLKALLTQGATPASSLALRKKL